MVFTTTSRDSPELATLVDSLSGDIENKPLQIAITTISQKLTAFFERSPSEDDEDQEAMESDSVEDFVSDCSDDSDWGLVPDEDKGFVRPIATSSQSNIFTPSALEMLKEDLKNAQVAGIGVGIFKNHPIAPSITVSLAVGASRLGLPDDVLEAWEMTQADFLVLLIQISADYKDIVSHFGRANDTDGLRFRFGKCASAKPSENSVRQALSTARYHGDIEKEQQQEDEDEDEDPPGSDRPLETLCMSKSIESLLSTHLFRLLKARLTFNISWSGAQSYLSDLSTSRYPEEVEVPRDTEPDAADLVSDLFEQDFADLRTVSKLNLPLVVMQFTMHRFKRCTEYCMVCHKKIEGGFAAIKPFICESELCSYQFITLGFGSNLEHEIIHNPYVVDLLVSFFWAAAHEGGLRNMPIGLGLKTYMPPESTGKSSRRDVLVDLENLKLDDSNNPLPPTNPIRPGDIFFLSVGRAMHDIPGFIREPLWTNSGYGNRFVCRVNRCVGVSWDFEIIASNPNYRSEPVPAPPKGYLKGAIFLQQNDVDSITGDPQRSKALAQLAEEIPSVLSMRNYLLASPGCALGTWNRFTPSSIKLLQWIVASNRSLIVQDDSVPDVSARSSDSHDDITNASAAPSSSLTLPTPAPAQTETPPTRRVTGLPSGLMQFRFAQGSPAKEMDFQTALEDEMRSMLDSDPDKVPTLFAWHGSPLKNWHSIIRSGLDFQTISHGRSSGNGVYFSPSMNYSNHYSRRGLSGSKPTNEVRLPILLELDSNERYWY